jgi:hypothetical protein
MSIVAKWVAKTTARQFKLGKDEKEQFDAAWKLQHKLTRTQYKKAQKKAAIAEVNLAMGRVASAVRGAPTGDPGHRFVRRMPLEGSKYVVFSDHHITHGGHRVDLFVRHNRALYAKVLDRYHGAGYTLIENGDVEDLVIFDPKVAEGELEARAKLELGPLRARRKAFRLGQLARILGDADYPELRTVLRKFDDDRRLVRTAGNHDYDLQRPEYLTVLRDRYPRVEQPHDYVFLTRGDGGAQKVEYVVMHGHQFDTAANPVSAPQFGETVSECLGVFYNGPDRVWSWGQHAEYWANGQNPLRNALVTDDVEWGREALSRADAADVDKKRLDPDVDPDYAPRGAGQVLASFGKDLFECLFMHNIAWEYFTHPDALAAVAKEVLTGSQWFKFRHLDEEFIRRQLLAHFPDVAHRPTLVLGHSHEPRYGAFSAAGGANLHHYVNAGAAGRFENLVWGSEIDADGARLVSWSTQAGGVVERREWAGDPADGALLRARAAASIPA